MNLLCVLLMACSNASEKPPAFDPAGLFEFTVSPEQMFSSQYRNSTSDYGTGRMKGLETGDSFMLEVTYSKPTRTATIDGLPVVLERSHSASDTGWSDTAGENWYGKAGSAVILSEPYGTLSQVMGAEYDLGESDCNISLTNSLTAKFSPTGSDATLEMEQRYDFDNSASCREALSKVQEQVFSSGTIPAFFFEWAYYQGVSLDQIDQLESLSFSYELAGSKIDDASGASRTEKGRTLEASISNSQRVLFGTSKSFRKLASPAILNLYR